MRRLPAFSASIALSVRRFLKETIGIREPWPRCVLAVSGGADSTALLHIFHALEISVAVAHLDHGLRPESASEAAHVERLASALNVPCFTERHDVEAWSKEQKIGLEDAGRRCRYAMLERVRREYGAEWIATGHHLDDLCEDVLLRLIRGAGWPALGGMRACDNERHIMRPLLHTSRNDLERLLREQQIGWCEDATNQEPIARRNRIRQDILPLLKAENPSFASGIRRLWTLARLDETHWNSFLEGFSLIRTDCSICLAHDTLRSLSTAARLRLYIQAVRNLVAVSGTGQARVETLLQLDKSWRERRTGAIFQLPGLHIRIERAGIVFFL